MITFKTRLSCLIGNDNKLLLINLLLFTAFLLGSCTTKDPIATPSVDSPIANPDYSIIDGDTVKTVVFKDYKKLKDNDPNGKSYIVVGDTIVTYKEPKLHTLPSKEPDLSKLKNNEDPDLKGKPLRMIAIGGSLTAGVRDGGYFNEGILTSYPNLIAQQMKLKKFEQPLFDATDYNGFGRKVRTGNNFTGGPVPKFNSIKNNSGVESVTDTEIKLKKTKGNFDNWGVPYMTLGGLLSAPLNMSIYSTSYDYKQKKYAPFLLRYASNEEEKKDISKVGIEGSRLTDKINTSKYDFVLFETGFDGIDELGGMYGLYLPQIIDRLNNKGKKTKICIATIPNYIKIPYFKKIKIEQIKEAISGNPIYNEYGDIEVINERTTFLPYSDMDSLVGYKVHISLKPGLSKKHPISSSSISNFSDIEADSYSSYMQLNAQIMNIAKERQFALADLRTLYEKISSGTYTEDGVTIDPRWPEGNFFSLDGRYPTPLGQAIIANEFIRSINATYKTDIPLISIKEYLNVQ